MIRLGVAFYYITAALGFASLSFDPVSGYIPSGQRSCGSTDIFKHSRSLEFRDFAGSSIMVIICCSLSNTLPVGDINPPTFAMLLSQRLPEDTIICLHRFIETLNGCFNNEDMPYEIMSTLIGRHVMIFKMENMGFIEQC